jgi:hypothetical protein
VGKANFGFVAKYKKGATIPEGQTEFQFKAGNLNFHSTTYQWLVVSGARAQYKGVGTINGAGDFGFMLTAIDSDLKKKGDPDMFPSRYGTYLLETSSMTTRWAQRIPPTPQRSSEAAASRSRQSKTITGRSGALGYFFFRTSRTAKAMVAGRDGTCSNFQKNGCPG